jgi:7-carboxy-7-deazaguanine synthase
LHADFEQYLFEEFTRHGRDRDNLTFSVSAKLPCSGEKWEDAIRPDVVKQYEMAGHTYLKFVISTKQDLQDVDRAVAEYRAAGFGGPVYVMPVGGVDKLYFANSIQVAQMAMYKGYRYSPRLQVDIWKNAWGT